MSFLEDIFESIGGRNRKGGWGGHDDDDDDEHDRRRGYRPPNNQQGARGKCQACGFLIDDDFNFCPGCGKKLPETMANNCSGCGAKMTENTAFCSKCGRKAQTGVESAK